MSLEIWPLVSKHEFKEKQRDAHRAELDWLIKHTRNALRELKHGVEDCYALMAPIEPGSTLVMSTQRNEKVKGTVTRVGSRIVKGTLHLQLRTLQPQVLTINPSKPIHIEPLMSIQESLNDAINLLTLTFDERSTPETLSAQLRVLAQLMADASATLKGDVSATPRGHHTSRAEPTWTHMSAAANAFDPPIDTTLSIHLTLQDSSIVLTLRSLENTDAPVFFGTKLGYAIGTLRRLEHDEMDKPFRYTFNREEPPSSRIVGMQRQPPLLSGTKPMEVFVREKVRVESADPNLMSLQAKLTSLHHTIIQLRQNLSTVMGVQFNV